MTIRASATLLAAGAVAAGIAFVDVTPARACGLDPYIGSVCVTAATFCPSGFMEADGRSLSVSQYQALFSLLGTTYGGNTTNFNLPDLRGRTPVGRNPTLNPSTGVVNTVALGQKRGAESYVMTGVFGHTHAATFTPGSGSLTVNIPVSSNSGTSTQALPDATHNYLAASLPGGVTAAAIWSDTLAQLTTVGGVTVSGGAGGTVDVASTGGAQTVPTLSPQLGMLHCIATTGVYPQRDY